MIFKKMHLRVFVVILTFTFSSFDFSYGQEEIPFLSHDQFEFELDYSFKAKPDPDNEVNIDGSKKRSSEEVLPYVKIIIRIINPPPQALKLKVRKSIKDFPIQIANKRGDVRTCLLTANLLVDEDFLIGDDGIDDDDDADADDDNDDPEAVELLVVC